MIFLSNCQKSILISICSFLIVFQLQGQTDIYWGGGSGDWDDPSHWYKEAAAINNAGVIPNASSIARFTNNSFSSNSKTLTIPPGSYDVHSIIVDTNEDFLMDFVGIDNNVLVMNVHGNLTLKSTHRLEYASSANPNNANNKWVFKRTSNQQNISTGNHDLLRVEFQNANVTFNQLSNLKASQQILMLNGTWNTNGFNVNAGLMLFNDGLPSNATRVPRVFNTGGSDIICEVWNSKNTYGSLTLVGNHAIYVEEFKGSPANGGPPFSVHEIHLLEYPDNTDGSTSAVDHMNFECTDCIIESMIIEDSGRAILGGAFTVDGKFTVVLPGTSVEFNGGNFRSNEVTFNGTIITPKVVGCQERVTFKNVHNDFTSLLRSSGTLTISDAILENIQASGGGNFVLSGGVLQGSSSGWNISNPPTPTDYYWLGETGVIHDWDDPIYWTLANGSSNGCLPSITDNVFFDSGSKGGIRVPANYIAECRDFIWTNQKEYELKLDGTSSLESILKVTGNIELDETAIVTGVLDHRFIFSSDNSRTIKTGNVQLPNVKFLGDNAQWTLQDSLSCDRLDFEAGTLNTDGYNVITDLWTSIEDNPKQYNFASSRIVVNGTFTLSLNNNSGVTVGAGTSLIECETLTSNILELYDVQMNNPSARTLSNYPYSFNKLILNGAGEVNTTSDLTLDVLEFKAEGSRLNLDANDILTINEGILSTTSAGNPGQLRSRTSGTIAEINGVGNICVIGPVSFTDINADIPGVFNAPFGVDGGNNLGIIYDNGSSSADLYWVGKPGGKWGVFNNWSRVNGGCPANKNPANAPKLFFNSNSFFESPVSVIINPAILANDVYFENSENLTIEVLGNSMINNLIIDGGYVNFIGHKILQVNTTDVQSGGFITTDMVNFRTNALIGNGGYFVIRAGSTARINP